MPEEPPRPPGWGPQDRRGWLVLAGIVVAILIAAALIGHQWAP